jgi:hypothetical protein
MENAKMNCWTYSPLYAVIKALSFDNGTFSAFRETGKKEKRL